MTEEGEADEEAAGDVSGGDRAGTADAVESGDGELKVIPSEVAEVGH